MAGDTIFKTKAFGGFNKDEVMAYIDKMLADKVGLDKQIANLNSTLARLNARVRELESDNAAAESLKTEIADLKSENTALNEKVLTIDSLVENNSLLEAENAELNEKIAVYTANSEDATRLSQKVTTLETELRVLKTENSEYINKIDELTAELEQSAPARDETRGELEALKAENFRLKAECEKMKAMEQQVGAAMLDARLRSDELVKDAREKANKVTREIYSEIGDTAVKIDGLSTGISEIARNFTKAVEEVELRINVLTGNMSKTAQALISDNVLSDGDKEKYIDSSSFDDASFTSEQTVAKENDDVINSEADEDEEVVFIGDENFYSPEYDKNSDEGDEASAEELPNEATADDVSFENETEDVQIPAEAEEKSHSDLGMGDIMYYSEGEIEFLNE